MLKKSRRWSLVIGLLLVLALPARPDFSAASKNLSNTPGSDSVYPKVVREPYTGIACVIWVEKVGEMNHLYLSRTLDEGTTWSAPQLLSGSGQILEGTSDLADYYAFSMVADVPYLHVVMQWRPDSSSDFEILYRRSDDLGETWDNWVTLTSNSTDSLYPDVAARAGYVHIAYQDSWPGNEEIFYKRIPGNGGGIPEQPRRMTYSGSDSLYARIAASKSGSIVNIVYEDSQLGQSNIYYKRIIDYGAGAYTTRQLTFGTGPSEWNSLPDITTSTSADGQYVYIIYQCGWAGNREIIYKRLDQYGSSAGITYTARLTYSATESRSNSIDFDAAYNYVHISYHDNWAGNYEVMTRKLSVYGGAGYTGQRVSWGTGDSSHSTIAASSASAFVVWSDNSSGNYEILIKKGS
jgi:hypothetical protein